MISIKAKENYRLFDNISTKEEKTKRFYSHIIESLSSIQKSILNHALKSQIGALSTRSRNTINSLSNSVFTISQLSDFIINPDYDFKSLKNIGHKSAEEIANFFSILRAQIEYINCNKDSNSLVNDLCNIFIKNTFRLESDYFSTFCRDYGSDEHIPIFRAVESIINSKDFYSPNEYYIFLNCFNFWTDSNIYSLEKVGEDLGLTRERVRQIRYEILHDFDNKFAFLKAFEHLIRSSDYFDCESPYIFLDHNTVEKIQRKESVKFNNLFISKLLSIMLVSTHYLIGNFDSLVFTASRSKTKVPTLQSLHLVDNNLSDIFDFQKLLNDIYLRLSTNIEEDYTFQFECYLDQFLKDGYENVTIQIIQVAEDILRNEFDIVLDQYDQITFKKSKKVLADYVYEILSTVNHPLNIDEIYERLENRMPGATKSAIALRGTCQRDKRFTPYGRSSTYGLREWEDSGSYFGGTMHDIAEEYLSQYNDPQHIKDITTYVAQKRANVTSKNLFNNLRSAKNRRFIFFQNSLIGIVSKTYDSKYKLYKNKYSKTPWEERFLELKHFCDNHNRRPSASIEEEKSLYRFLTLQRKKLYDNELDSEKSKMLIDLLSQYEGIRNTQL